MIPKVNRRENEGDMKREKRGHCTGSESVRRIEIYDGEGGRNAAARRCDYRAGNGEEDGFRGVSNRQAVYPETIEILPIVFPMVPNMEVGRAAWAENRKPLKSSWLRERT